MILFDFYPRAEGKTPVPDKEAQKMLISENKAIVMMTAFSVGILVAEMSLLCNFI